MVSFTSEGPATASAQSVDSGSGSDAFTSSPVHAADPHVQREVPVETSTSELPATASTQSVDSGSGSECFHQLAGTCSRPARTAGGAGGGDFHTRATSDRVDPIGRLWLRLRCFHQLAGTRADPHVQREVPAVETSTRELPATASTHSIDSGSGSDAFTSSPVHAADPHVQREVPAVETSTRELPATASTHSIDSGSSSDAFTSSPVHAADPHVQRRCRRETSTRELPATASTHSIDSGSSSDAFTSSPVHAADPHVQREVPAGDFHTRATSDRVDPIGRPTSCRTVGDCRADADKRNCPAPNHSRRAPNSDDFANRRRYAAAHKDCRADP